MTVSAAAGRLGRLGALARLVLVVAFEVGAVWALAAAGSSVGAVRWDRVGEWLAETPAEVAVASAARFVGLVLAWWLLASTVLYVVACVTRLSRLARGLRFVTLPGIRHLVDASLALAVTTSAIGGSAIAAGASPQPAAVVLAAPGVAPTA